jgi:hypothetical protein
MCLRVLLSHCAQLAFPNTTFINNWILWKRSKHWRHFLTMVSNMHWGTRWRSWLRHWAIHREITGSIPDGAIEIFHWHNPSCRTMALGLTQPLTELSTRNISWRVKAAGALGWQPCHLHVPIVLKSGSFNLLEPSGPVKACNGIALPLSNWQYAFCKRVVETDVPDESKT